MSYKHILFSCAVLILLNCVCYSQTVNSNYEVGTWPGFKSAAISFTFDDGCSNQFAVAMPLFDKYNFKMTFFTVINWSPNWTTLSKAAANGHEVASHTLSHANLSGLTDEQQTSELRDSKSSIESHITNQKCLTIAYPYCATGNTTLCKQYYLAARGCSGAVEPKTPTNFMNISSIICGSQGSIQRTSDFTSKFNSAANSKGLVVLLIHGIDNDGGYSSTSSTELNGALEYLNTNADKFWVPTFGDVARYIKERNCVSVKETSVSDTSISFSITDTLDNSVFDLPVTVRRQIPTGWDSLSVLQNGKVISYKFVDANSKKYVMMSVVPDSGTLVMKRITLTDVEDHPTSLLREPYLKQNYPNPFNPVTTIDYQIAESGFVKLRVYDVLGRVITTLVNEELSPGYYSVKFDGMNHPSGLYFYSLQTGRFCDTKKLLLLK
jgi:hypothetical protein